MKAVLSSQAALGTSTSLSLTHSWGIFRNPVPIVCQCRAIRDYRGRWEWLGLSFKQKPHNKNLFAEGFVENQFGERHKGFVTVCAVDAGILPLPCV